MKFDDAYTYTTAGNVAPAEISCMSKGSDNFFDYDNSGLSIVAEV